jgi:hypothetical protein
MSENKAPEVPTERDRVAGRLIGVALAATFVALVTSTVVVWLLATRVSHGGGRSNEVDLALEPPADPFDQTTLHEHHRLEQLHALASWAWLDASHTRVRVPIDVAIDRYLAGGTP